MFWLTGCLAIEIAAVTSILWISSLSRIAVYRSIALTDLPNVCQTHARIICLDSGAAAFSIQGFTEVRMFLSRSRPFSSFAPPPFSSATVAAGLLLLLMVPLDRVLSPLGGSFSGTGHCEY